MKRVPALLAVLLCLTALTACHEETAAEMRYCENCGAYIFADVSSCGFCDAAVQDGETQPATDAAPVQDDIPQTDPSETEHTHSYVRSVVAPTCTREGYDIYTCTCGDSYTTNRIQSKGHSYVKKVTPATCTEQGYTTYTCSCGDAYRGDFVQPSHRYVNYICTSCGAREVNYSGFQAEYDQLTAQYNANVADLRNKILECQNNISSYEREIELARLELKSPIPSCPQSFRQPYIDNYRLYGDTYTANQAAQAAWEQQCNKERAALQDTIYLNQSKIQTEQAKISTYNTMITSYTDQYNGNVDVLERKYGLS